jgi:hypothetical protein
MGWAIVGRRRNMRFSKREDVKGLAAEDADVSLDGNLGRARRRLLHRSIRGCICCRRELRERLLSASTAIES